MTGLIERAIASEIAPAKLAFDVLDGDDQPAGEQIIAVAANRFWASELQRVRVAPFCWPTHHDDPDW
jgi:hypothetical protein